MKKYKVLFQQNKASAILALMALVLPVVGSSLTGFLLFNLSNTVFSLNSWHETIFSSLDFLVLKRNISFMLQTQSRKGLPVDRGPDRLQTRAILRVVKRELIILKYTAYLKVHESWTMIYQRENMNDLEKNKTLIKSNFDSSGSK